MGTRQTLDVLQSYASMLNDLGDRSGAEAVRALAGSFSAAEDKTVKATVAKVAKLWAVVPDGAMSPAGLVKRLVALQGLLAAGGAKAASADVKLLAELLDARDAAEPAVFERALRYAISAPVVKPPKVPRRELLSEADMRQWADRLTAVSADQRAFEAELSALLAIPKLSGKELRAVAEQYLGHQVSGAKDKILKALRTRQKQDAIEASRQGRLSHIAV